MSEIISKAREIAEKAHQGQYRKDGKTPYIVHPERVAAKLSGESDIVIATAWAHDSIEDGGKEVDDLIKTLPSDVITAIVALTKASNESYSLYLERVKANPIARKVKVADILDNLSDDPSPRQIVKYAKALLFLVEGE